MNVTIEITPFQISSLLTGALEGGSHYWAAIDSMVTPTGTITPFTGSASGEVFPHLDYPLNEGGAVLIEDCEGGEDGGDPKIHRLDLTSIQRGLEVMAKTCHSSWARFMEVNYDSSDSDVFLQCCLFGEVIYG